MESRSAGRILNICLAIILLGGGFLVWHYKIDGIYVNRVLTFINGVDPMNLQTDKAVYAPGETPEVLSAFCKNRDSITMTHWTLINEHPHFNNGDFRVSEVAPGCYPKQGKYLRAPTLPIPDDLYEGEYHYVGVSRQYLPDGRIRTQYYQTELFTVRNK